MNQILIAYVVCRNIMSYATHFLCISGAAPQGLAQTPNSDFSTARNNDESSYTVCPPPTNRMDGGERFDEPLHVCVFACSQEPMTA
jgi:hypothetical protein